MPVTFAIVLLISFAIPLVLWLAISRETSNPTVVDRAEAERIAKEHGGRNPSRSADRSDRSSRVNRRAGLDRDGRQSPTVAAHDAEDEWDDRREF